MNCTNCNARMVQYQGFDERGPSGDWECLKGCAPETKEAPISEGSICGGAVIPVMGPADNYACLSCYEVYAASYVCARSSISHLFTCNRLIPTRSTPAQSVQGSTATQASSQLRRRQGYQGIDRTVQGGTPSKLYRNQAGDNPDPCSSQLQAGHPPRTSGTPKPQSGAWARVKEMEMQDSLRRMREVDERIAEQLANPPDIAKE
jgi:hypothetical protein